MSFSSWLERAAEAERNRTSLEEALLGDRFSAYAGYRLRWVLLSRGVGLAVHLVEFAFLAHIFASQSFAGALAVQNAAMLSAALWWGALELLRNRLQAPGWKQLAAAETGAWIARGALGATGVVAALVGFLAWRALAGELAVLDAYVAVVGARLAVDLVARSYYAGVYARRRVYRPVAAILATEVVGLVAILLLWGTLGAWSFPIGLAISVAASRGLLVTYTARAYETLRIPAPQVSLRAAFRRRRERGAIRTVLWAALANASTRIGSALVLIVLASGGGAGAVVIVLHLLAPLIATAASWPQVFYLDFRKLEDTAAGGLRRRLAARLRPLSLCFGFGAWLVGAAAVASLVGLERAAAPLAALLPLMIAHAYLARLQLQYFALKQYARVALGAAVVGCGALVGLGMIEWAFPRAGQVSRSLALAAALALGALVIAWARERRPVEPARGVKRSLLAWLRAVARIEDEPVGIRAARMAEAHADQRGHVVRWLADRLGERGAAVATRRGRIYWFERGDAPAAVDLADLAVAAGGLIDGIERAPPARGGRRAVAEAARAGVLAAPAPGSAEAAEDALIARFRELFPAGRIEALAEPRGGRELFDLEPAVRRALWADALLHARGGRRSGRRSSYDVTTFAPGGEIAILFAVHQSAPSRLRSTWRRHLERVNWDEALYGRLDP